MASVTLRGVEYTYIDELAFDLGEAALEYIVSLPTLMGSEREKLEEAREIVLRLKALEEER